MNLTKKT